MESDKAKGDVSVSLSDQQQINRFARLNSRVEELKEERDAHNKTLVNLEDAATELMLIEDDEQKVSYQKGEVFVLVSQDEAQSLMDESKEKLKERVADIQGKMDKMSEEMAGLKAKLYAKFGDAINLEPDEEE